jgi:hypothetical protein
MMFSWSIESQSVANNTTTIAWTLKGYRTDGATGYITCGGFKVVIDGTTVLSKSTDYRVDVRNGDVVASGSHTISHASDGTKSFTAYAEAGIYYSAINCSGSANFTLNAIARASVPSVSASTVALGNKIKISVTAYSNQFTHDLSYALTAQGSSTVVASGTIGTGVAFPYEWTVPLTLAAKIPNTTEGRITITCTTRFPNTSDVVGSKPVSFDVTVPNNSTTQPTVSITLSPVGSLPSAFSGLYIAGKSQVKVSYTATSDDSTIVSYHTSVNGSSGSSNPYTSTLLKDSGTVTITSKVTDARGYFTTLTNTIDVIPYGRPRIIPVEGQRNIVCTRCNSDGKADPGGVYLLIKVGRKYEKVVSGGVQKNRCKLSYRWKTDAQTDSEYSAPVELLATGATTDYVDTTTNPLSGIVTSNTTAYNIQFIVEDTLGESDTFTITVPTAFVTFHVPEGGHGITLGGYHDPDKYDVFDCRFDAEFQGTVSGSVMGLLGSSGEIPGDGDLNDYKTPGVYAVSTDNNAKTITNMPPGMTRAGLLRVYASLGQDYVSEGTWRYITQEYRSLFPGTPDYRRRLWTDATGTWSYSNWVSGIDDVVHLAGSATQITGNIYSENGVETCQFMIRAGSDYHVLNLTPSGMVYGKNGKVLWTK